MADYAVHPSGSGTKQFSNQITQKIRGQKPKIITEDHFKGHDEYLDRFRLGKEMKLKIIDYAKTIMCRDMFYEELKRVFERKSRPSADIKAAIEKVKQKIDLPSEHLLRGLAMAINRSKLNYKNRVIKLKKKKRLPEDEKALMNAKADIDLFYYLISKDLEKDVISQKCTEVPDHIVKKCKEHLTKKGYSRKAVSHAMRLVKVHSGNFKKLI